MSAVLQEPSPHFTTSVKPKFGVLRFPGSNCDQDAYFVIRDVLGCPAEYVWHQDTGGLAGFDIVLKFPGGFSYGDYLRTGRCPFCADYGRRTYAR